MLKIASCKSQGAGIVAKAQASSDRTAAEQLKGWRIFIPRSSFPTPEANEYYWIDLIGLEVINREGVKLGCVQELISTGPHDVLVLALPATHESVPKGKRLIPFVNAYIDSVDLENKQILVDWQPDY